MFIILIHIIVLDTIISIIVIDVYYIHIKYEIVLDTIIISIIITNYTRVRMCKIYYGEH